MADIFGMLAEASADAMKESRDAPPDTYTRQEVDELLRQSAENIRRELNKTPDDGEKETPDDGEQKEESEE